MMILKKNNKLIRKAQIAKEQARIARQDNAMAILISGIEITAIDSDTLSMVANKVCGPESELALINLRKAYRGLCEFQVRQHLGQINVNALDAIF